MKILTTSKESLVFLFLDLEVNAQNKIYRLGWKCCESEGDYFEKDFSLVNIQLQEFCQQNYLICGHNFRRFDYRYLTQQFPNLDSWLVMDTLELSILAFPLQPSHKLNKEYKDSQYASNNPCEDAKATQKLLATIWDVLVEHPLFPFYCWLLTCGDESADKAYQKLFKIDPHSLKFDPFQFCFKGSEIIVNVNITKLPNAATDGFEVEYLEEFWEYAPVYSFEHRLCLAALLAWNYERNQEESNVAYSGWLKHLPKFTEVINGLRPLKPEKVSYESYLEQFDIPPTPGFRPKQKEAIEAIMAGESPLILMPTGGGKSLCYQLPALMLYERQKLLTVVISPLQALMADQVADLEATGLDFGTFINGTLTQEERRLRLQQVQDGEKGLLYISPEQARSRSIRHLLSERPPAFWVIDEAHCVSHWGHNFRTDYRYLPKFIAELYIEKKLPSPRLALLTATATVAVRDDIKELFEKHKLPVKIDEALINTDPRLNLAFEVIPCADNKEQLLVQQVRQSLREGGCVLVYTTTRKKAEELAILLNRSNIPARFYHGKLDRDEKEEVLQAFKSRELNVVTATCAFGMGINRKDVRAVIHHTLSSSLEAYVQEAGRAGRDEEPASCKLFFNRQDADTVFFLKSLGQLNESDLIYIFLTVRNWRKKILGRASEEWFWITTSDIFQNSELDEKFASETEQRETKIKVALHYLEQFGFLERQENLAISLQFRLIHNSLEQSLKKFQNSLEYKQLNDNQKQQFWRLISAMHKMQSKSEKTDTSLDLLSDLAGVSIMKLPTCINLLKRAGVCSYEIPVTVYVVKTGATATRPNFDRLKQTSIAFLEILFEKLGNKNSIQLNLRALVSQLDPDYSQKLKGEILLKILENWSRFGWVKFSLMRSNIVRVFYVDESISKDIEKHHDCCSLLIEVLYREMEGQTSAKYITTDVGHLAEKLSQMTPARRWYFRDIKQALQGLVHLKLIRITEGTNLFQQAMKVRVFKQKNISTIKKHYLILENFYKEEIRRTHIMLAYGQFDEIKRVNLVKHYFSYTSEKFKQTYPQFYQKNAPVIDDDYDRILNPLNDQQREVVRAEDPALAIIAGPGSGKTRTILHRLAYLVKVKRVRPDRVLLLAYNRNAKQELQSRLYSLIGNTASSVRIFTFHGLALALLGRTLGQETATIDLNTLLPEACKLIETGDELDEEDNQVRRAQLLGNVEYIFVDEYQDVGETEYRFIQLLAGLGDSEDEKRAVQINLCVIGDDDQNIYSFRGTNPRYIRQFEKEYKAKRFLLTENYRSTEAIISAANQLIQHNLKRCKQHPDEQVRIDRDRVGETGLPVEAWRFQDTNAQAGWIQQKVQNWLTDGVFKHEIAILAKEWNQLSKARLLLESAGISTHALNKSNDIKLTRHRVTQELIERLQKNPHKVLSEDQSVVDWFNIFCQQHNYHLAQSTIQVLHKIMYDLDKERGYSYGEMALPISAEEILTAIFEFSQSNESFTQEDAVLVTSCHGAKGLEFRKVILLTERFCDTEDERRLCYVGMTRAKEELALCSITENSLITQAGLVAKFQEFDTRILPHNLKYLDFIPKDVYLGHRATLNRQQIITQLREGMPLQLKVNRFENGWDLYTKDEVLIGALSRHAHKKLHQEIDLGFKFQPGEVSVKHIYYHLKRDQLTEKIEDHWYVVIPQIRICR